MLNHSINFAQESRVKIKCQIMHKLWREMAGKVHSWFHTRFHTGFHSADNSQIVFSFVLLLDYLFSFLATFADELRSSATNENQPNKNSTVIVIISY